MGVDCKGYRGGRAAGLTYMVLNGSGSCDEGGGRGKGEEEGEGLEANVKSNRCDEKV